MRALLKFESCLYFWRFLDRSVKLLHLANYFHLLRKEQWSSCLYRGVVQKRTVLFALSPAEQTHGSMCSWLRWRKACQCKGLFAFVRHGLVNKSVFLLKPSSALDCWPHCYFAQKPQSICLFFLGNKTKVHLQNGQFFCKHENRWLSAANPLLEYLIPTCLLEVFFFPLAAVSKWRRNIYRWRIR